MTQPTTTSPRASFQTLGCRVNQYESDAIADMLRARGFTIVPFGDPCDITIVNTCTVTAESDRKSRQFIRRAASMNPGTPLIVTGCFAQAFEEKAASIPGVSLVVGNAFKERIPDYACALLAGETVTEECCAPIENAGYDTLRMVKPHRARTFIKIEDGCENRCAYCIIPKARGNIRSKLPQTIVEEASFLAEQGSPEIILTGIETAAYGRDSHGTFSLTTLLPMLDAIPQIHRITLGSLDPSLLRDEFLQMAASLPSVLPHFHLSLQSGSSGVLRRMRRPYNAVQAMERICAIRRLFPEAMLTADMIVGFPGETEEEFRETVEFCREARLLHLHIFPYSIRVGTEAASMPNQIPDTIKRTRAAELAAIQAEQKQAILTEYVAAHSESPVYVLVEEEKNNRLIGHSEHFVEVCFPGDVHEIGQIVPVCLTGTDGVVCTGVHCRKK